MKRNPVELVLRALKNSVANWQLVAIRMVESVVFVFLIFLALLATIIPAAVAAGLGKLNVLNSEDARTAVAEFIVNQWPLIVWTLVVIFLLTGVMIVIHALIVAGSTRVYLDGERAAGSRTGLDAFTVFRGDAFWAAAKRGFWRIFWIYNLGWGLGALIVSVPMLFLLLLIRFTADTQTMVVLIGLVFVGAILLAVPIGIVTTVWVGRAIIESELAQLPARAALAASRKAIRADLGGHILVPLLVFIISFGAIAITSGIGGFSAISEVLGPLDLIASLLQMLVSALASAWMLAAFAALGSVSS